MWKVGDKDEYKEGYTSGPIHREDSTSVLSIFSVSETQYIKSTVSCAVVHANMENTRSPLLKATSKSKSTCRPCPACTNDYN